VVHDKVGIKYVTGHSTWPPGLQPAFCFCKGYIVLGTSPEAVQRFNSLPEKEFTHSSGEVPFLRLSVTQLQAYLKQWREPLCTFLAEKNQISKKDALNHLDSLVGVLELFDQVEIFHQGGNGMLAITVRVKTGKPLK
jgi:hypothetical protein